MNCANCGAEYLVETWRGEAAVCPACTSTDARPVSANERRTRRNSLIGAVTVLLAVLMLVAGVGAAALWIALVIVGIIIVVIDRIAGRRGAHA